MKDDEYLLRYWLWLKHSRDHYLYGDDGELQCSNCGIDFKRDPVAVIDKKLQDNNTQWIIDHADEINEMTLKAANKKPTLNKEK